MTSCEQKVEKFKELEIRISTLKESFQTKKYKERNKSDREDFIKDLRELLKIQKEVKELGRFGFDLENFHKKTKPFILERWKKDWRYNIGQRKKSRRNIETLQVLPFDEYLNKLPVLVNEPSDKRNIGKIIQCEETPNYTFEELKTKLTVIDPEKEMEEWFDTFRQQNNRNVKFYEVLQEIHNRYPDKIFADVQTFKTIQENQTKEIEKLLKPKMKWLYYFCPGFTFVSMFGSWNCEDFCDFEDQFKSGYFELKGGWCSDFRVLLLDK